MLKFLFWILLLANAGLFVYERGYLQGWIADGHEPERIKRQFKPELVKQIASPAIAVPPVADAAPPPVAPPAPEPAVCKEIGNFDAATARRFEAKLQPLALAAKLSRRDVSEVAHNIVFIPSQGSKEGADKKANELKHLGVTDFYIIQDAGDMQWGISLGVFKTEEAARAQLAVLSQKGVHSARLGSHNVSATKVAFQLRGLDSGAAAAVEKVVHEFPRAETRDCVASAGTGSENRSVAHAVSPALSSPHEAAR